MKDTARYQLKREYVSNYIFVQTIRSFRRITLYNYHMIKVALRELDFMLKEHPYFCFDNKYNTSREIFVGDKFLDCIVFEGAY